MAIASLSAALAATAPPVLNIGRIGEERVELSWFAADGAFVLETSGNPGPSPLWRAATMASIRQGERETVVLEVGDAPRFFRLRRPIHHDRFPYRHDA